MGVVGMKKMSAKNKDKKIRRLGHRPGRTSPTTLKVFDRDEDALQTG